MEYPGKEDFLGCGVIFDELKYNYMGGVHQLYGAKQRSPKWPEFSKTFLWGKVCWVCGGKFRLVAHHIVPFHQDPSLELEVENLIPLCEGRYSCNCHLTFGHLGNWTLANPQVREMSQEYALRYRQARTPGTT